MSTNRKDFKLPAVNKQRPKTVNKAHNSTLKSSGKTNQTLDVTNVSNYSKSSVNSVKGSKVEDGSASKEYNDIERKLAFNEYLQTVYLDALLQDKVKKEKADMEVKMAELAKQIEMHSITLSKTNSRLKEIACLAEQQRILEEQCSSMNIFDEEITKNEAERILADLSDKEDRYCDRLSVDGNNVSFGYTRNERFQAINAALEETLQPLEELRERCGLLQGEQESRGDWSSVTQQLKAWQDSEKEVRDNIKECLAILPQVSKNVLDNTSNNLGQIEF